MRHGLTAGGPGLFQHQGTFTVGSYYDWRTMARALHGRIPPSAVIVSDRWLENIYYLQRPAHQLLPAYRVWGAGDWEAPERDYSARVQKAEHLKRMVEASCRPVTLPDDLRFMAAFDRGG